MVQLFDGVPGGMEKFSRADATLPEKSSSDVGLRPHDGQLTGQTGSGVMEISTEPANPPVPNNTIVELAVDPTTLSEEPSNVRGDGQAAIEKSGVTSPKLAVCTFTGNTFGFANVTQTS
jgi:hypothetical protein